MASSLAAADVLAEVLRHATLGSVSLTTVTIVVRTAFQPTAFAGCVFWQLLAVEAETINVGTVAFGFGFAGTGSDERALLVLVAAEERSTISGVFASSLDTLHLGGVSGRAHLHERLALPSRLGGASVGLVVTAVHEGGRVGGQDTVGHHGAGSADGIRGRLVGHDAAEGDEQGEDGELHGGWRVCVFGEEESCKERRKRGKIYLHPWPYS